MTEIVEAFVATLGLDPTEYNTEIKKYREDRKRLSEEEQKQNRVSQDGQSRTVAGLRQLRNETAGFLLMLAGATSVVGFAKDMLTADAATGRFAKNVGMSTERVSVWENAIKRAGGTAQEAQQAIATLFNIYQNRKLFGDASKSGALAFFGLNEADLKDPEAALLRIAEVLKKMPREDVEAQLATLGLSGSIVGLLAGDRGELTKLLASVEAAGVANDESAEAAMSLEEEMAKIAQTIQGAARPAITELTKAFLVLTEVINGLINSRGMEMLNDIFGNGDIATIRSQAEKDAENDTPEQRALRNEFSGNFEAEKRRRNPGTISGLMGMALEAATGGGRGATGNGNRNAAAVERYFQRKGFSPAQARGIAASVVAEGGLARRTGGGYKGRALGIGQLLGSRRATFLRRYGKNFTFQNELDFMYEEMNNDDGQHVAGRIKRSGSSGAIARMMVDQFFRPAKGAQTIGDYQRASKYLREPVGAYSARSAAGRPATNTTTVGQIIVNTQATDAKGIVRDMRGEIAKRGIVAQAGSGLRP